MGRVWRAMRNYFRITALVTQIEQITKQFTQQIVQATAAHGANNSPDYNHQPDNDSLRAAHRTYKTLDSCAKSLVVILNPNEVEQSLMSLDELRTSSESPRKVPPPVYNRSLSESQNFPSSNGHADSKRHHSLPADEPAELEPVDLLHLNIRASLISIQSKLTSCRPATLDDYEPSRRKLLSAVVALKRVAALTYAVEAVKLERDQLELFYSMRLRRSIIFSQALTCKC